MAYYLDPKNDLIFKRIFGEHKHLCMSLLNSMLPLSVPIASLEYEPNELIPVKPEFKNSLVDVRCTDTLGRQFIVEMQMVWTDSFKLRMLLNASKALAKQVEKGQDFETLKPVYALSLVNAIFREKSKDYYHRYLITDVADASQKIDGMEFVFVELPKFKAQNITDPELKILWLRFLTEINGSTEQVPAALTSNIHIKEALDYAKRGAYSDLELATYDKHLDAVMTHKMMLRDSEKAGRQEGIAEGEARGKAEGRQAGIQEGIRTTAKNLKSLGIPLAQISTATGLSLEEIEHL
jgi:predicted transposase/invertase (TIGR01784 family)